MHWKSENRNGKSKRNTRRKKLQQEQNRIRKKYSERFSTFVNLVEHANKHTSPVCICQPDTSVTATQNNNYFKFILCSFLSRFFFKKTRAPATSSTATCTIPALWLDDQILFRLHEAEQCLRKHQFTAEPSWLDLIYIVSHIVGTNITNINNNMSK